jgi:hypothetical protein
MLEDIQKAGGINSAVIAGSNHPTDGSAVIAGVAGQRETTGH